MPLPFLAQAGLMAAPSAMKLFTEAINPSRPTAYENKMNDMAGVLGEEANMPVTENQIFKTGKRQLEESRRKTQQSVTNVVGAGNMTHETKLAATNDANATYQAALNRLMSNAQRYRDVKQGQFMNALGRAENARFTRQNQRRQDTAAWLNPLSSATNSFVMADMIGAGGGSGKKPGMWDFEGGQTAKSVASIFNPLINLTQ